MVRIDWWPVNSSHKGPVMSETFPCHDVKNWLLCLARLHAYMFEIKTVSFLVKALFWILETTKNSCHKSIYRLRQKCILVLHLHQSPILLTWLTEIGTRIIDYLPYSISQEICTRFCCALLCCGYAIVHNEFTWSIYPYSSGLLCWHWGNR